MIGDDVVITVLDVEDKRVRIGIDAPKDISVHREEVFDKIKAEIGDDHENRGNK